MCSQMCPERPVRSVRGPGSDHRRARVSAGCAARRPSPGWHPASTHAWQPCRAGLPPPIHSAPAGAGDGGGGPAHGAPGRRAERTLGSPSQGGGRGAWAQRLRTCLNTAQRAEWGSQPGPSHSRPPSGRISASPVSAYKAPRGGSSCPSPDPPRRFSPALRPPLGVPPTLLPLSLPPALPSAARMPSC